MLTFSLLCKCVPDDLTAEIRLYFVSYLKCEVVWTGNTFLHGWSSGDHGLKYGQAVLPLKDILGCLSYMHMNH